MYHYTYRQIRNIIAMAQGYNPVKGSRFSDYTIKTLNASPFEDIIIEIVDASDLLKKALPDKYEQQLFIDVCVGLSDIEVAFKYKIEPKSISNMIKKILYKVKRYIKIKKRGADT